MELINLSNGRQAVKGQDSNGNIRYVGITTDKDNNVSYYKLDDDQLLDAQDKGSNFVDTVIEGTKSGLFDAAATATKLRDVLPIPTFKTPDRHVKAYEKRTGKSFYPTEQEKKERNKQELKYFQDEANIARHNAASQGYPVTGVISRYIPTFLMGPSFSVGKGLSALGKAALKSGLFTAGEEAFYNYGIDEKDMTLPEKLKASAQAGLFGAGFGGLLNAAGQGVRAFKNKRALGKGENASEEAKAKGEEQVNRGTQEQDDLINGMSDILNDRQPTQPLALPPAQARSQTVVPESQTVVPSGALPPAQMALPPAPARYGEPMPTAEGWQKLYDFDKRLDDYENTNSLVRALNEADTTDLQRLTRPEISMREQLALPPAIKRDGIPMYSHMQGWGDDTLADTWGRAGQAPSEYELATARSLARAEEVAHAERLAEEAAVRATRRANAEDAFGRQLGEMSARETNALRSADEIVQALARPNGLTSRLNERRINSPVYYKLDKPIRILKNGSIKYKDAISGKEINKVLKPSEKKQYIIENNKVVGVTFNPHTIIAREGLPEYIGKRLDEIFPAIKASKKVTQKELDSQVLPKTETPINPTPSTTTKSLNEAIAEQKAILDDEMIKLHPFNIEGVAKRKYPYSAEFLNDYYGIPEDVYKNALDKVRKVVGKNPVSSEDFAKMLDDELQKMVSSGKVQLNTVDEELKRLIKNYAKDVKDKSDTFSLLRFKNTADKENFYNANIDTIKAEENYIMTKLLPFGTAHRLTESFDELLKYRLAKKNGELSDPIPKKANKTSIADLDEVQRQAIYNNIKDNDLKALGINRKNINALEKILRSPVGLSTGLDKNNTKTFNAINEYLQKANTTAEGNIVKQADKVIDSPANALDEIINDADTILRKEVYDVAKELKIGKETATDIFAALSTNATYVHPQLQKPYNQIVQRLNEKRATEARLMEDLMQTEEALRQINPNYLKGLGIGLGTAGLVTGFNTEEAEANMGSAFSKGLSKLLGTKTANTASKGTTETVDSFSSKVPNRKTWDAKAIAIGRHVVETIKNTDLANWLVNTKMSREHDYLKYRDVLDTQLQRSYSNVDKIFRTLSELPLNEREDLHKLMTGQDAIGASKQVKQLANTFTKEITKLSQRLVDLGIITQKTHDEWAGMYLHRTYENSIKKNLIRDFRRMKTVHPIFERGMAENLTAADVKFLEDNGMIGKISEGKISVTKNADGTYTGRRDWTPEERAIMGEITDGAFTVSETFKHLYEMVHTADFLKNIANHTNVGTMDDVVGYKTLKGRKWGAMDGMSVPTHIYQDLLNQHNSIFGHQGGFQRIWHTYLSAMKKSWTIYNPVSHLNNVMSNVTFMASQGMDTHRAFLDTMKGFSVLKKAEEFKALEAKTLAGTADNTQIARLNELSNDADVMLYKEAEEAGIFGKTKLQEMLYPANVSRKRDGLSKIGQPFENAYHAEDNAARFAFYKYLKNDMGLDTMAAKKGVQSIMPDYTAPMSRAASLARNTGIIPFISWTYHTFPALMRTLAPIGIVKGDRLRPYLRKSPYGKGINNYQAWNTIKTVLLVQALGEALQGGTGVPDEQPKNWKRQRPISWRSGDDVTGIKMDRWFGQNDWLPMNIPTTLMNFATGGIPQKIAYSLIDIDPYRGTKITYRDGLSGAYDRIKYYANNFVPVPSILRSAYGVGEAALVEPKARKSNQFYNPRSLGEAALSLGGINVRSYNAPMFEDFQENQLLKELKKQNKENNREKRKQRKTMQTRPTR